MDKVLYEVTKTLRFSLEEKIIKRPYIASQATVTGDDLKLFISNYKQLIDNFEKIVFLNKINDGEVVLNPKIKIKKGWLRVYNKQAFYDNNSEEKFTTNKAKLACFEYLGVFFENWIKENRDVILEIKKISNCSMSEQMRFSDLFYWIRKIASRNYFDYVFELFNGNIENVDNDKDVDDTCYLLDEIKKELNSLKNSLLPAQSIGQEIERASLNYYTVNKNPREYPRELEEEKNNLSKVFRVRADIQQLLNKNGFNDSFGVEKLKGWMKKFKSAQKSAFYEFVNKNGSYQNLKESEDLCLLNDITEDKFKKFKSNPSNRYKHFQDQYTSFNKYKNFCIEYKKVAMEVGKIKARIKGIENEKIDAGRIGSWALMLEKDGQKYLLTIPRSGNDNLKNAKNFIEKIKDDSLGIWFLYRFESLTLKALDKLCFGLSNNSFAPQIKNELMMSYKCFFEGGKMKRKDQFLLDNIELIKFYQAVLSLDVTRQSLAVNDFTGFDQLIQTRFNTMVDFEKCLKQTCYFKNKIKISETMKNEIVKNFSGNFYKITSYDLQKNDSEIIEKLKEPKEKLDRKNFKEHTKIWESFWEEENKENKYPIRLNPEFKINFVPKKRDKNDAEEFFWNRNARDRYLLSITITQGADGKSASLSFKGMDEIKEFIAEYNKEFNSKITNPYEFFYYGLDRGQKELLTLGIFKFSETEKVKIANGSEYNKPFFVDLDVYELPFGELMEKDEKGRIAYKNISYFENLLEKKSVKSCLDLSYAKIINGKIVVNGDISTYLALKEVSAKRKIYEGVSTGKYVSDKMFYDSEKGVFYLSYINKGEKEEDDIYFFDKRFEDVESLRSITNKMENYFNEVKRGDKMQNFITIQRVNNLRDAICANAVGVITFLHKKFPGMIFLEDLNESNKNTRQSEFSGNLGSRIEWKLLQKFRSLSLVPPIYNQIMRIKDSIPKKEDSDYAGFQIGAIGYISTKNTSNACPYCGLVPKGKEEREEAKKEKYINHAYRCKGCGFYTGTPFGLSMSPNRLGLEALDNCDNVATYNIAKKGLTYFLGYK